SRSSKTYTKMFESRKSPLIHLVPRELVAPGASVHGEVAQDRLALGECPLRAGIPLQPAAELLVQGGVLPAGAGAGALDEGLVGGERDVLHARRIALVYTSCTRVTLASTPG